MVAEGLCAAGAGRGDCQRDRVRSESESGTAPDQGLYTGFAIYDKEGEMAQRVTIEMMDDLDGSQADETVRFAVDGSAYEIDLSNKNAAEMRRTFDRYIEHARKAGRTTRQARTSRNRHYSSDVRAWAKSQGIQINERGRIPASIVAEYEAANA